LPYRSFSDSSQSPIETTYSRFYPSPPLDAPPPLLPQSSLLGPVKDNNVHITYSLNHDRQRTIHPSIRIYNDIIHGSNTKPKQTTPVNKFTNFFRHERKSISRRQFSQSGIAGIMLGLTLTAGPAIVVHSLIKYNYQESVEKERAAEKEMEIGVMDSSRDSIRVRNAKYISPLYTGSTLPLVIKS
jgi:hypothetical protein